VSIKEMMLVCVCLLEWEKTGILDVWIRGYVVIEVVISLMRY